MYTLNLTESYIPPQPGTELLTTTIGDELRRAASSHADRCALVELRSDGELARRWSYAELYRESHALALQLSARFEKGARIAVCANNIPEWVILEYAAALSGLVLVTLNPSYQQQEISYVVEHSGSVAIFYVPSVRGNDIEQHVNAVQSSNPDIKYLVNMLDSKQFPGNLDVADVSLPTVNVDDPVQIQYTSGTTGLPKGVRLKHHGLLNNGLLIAERLEMSESDSYLNIMPMFHTGGCGVGTLAPLSVRAGVVLAAEFVPEAVNNAIEQERVSVMLGVPTMLSALLQNLKEKPRDHSSMRSVFSGGSMVPPTLVKTCMDAWGCSIQVIYGQTEVSPGLTLTWSGDSFEYLTESVGQPLAHTEVCIKDTATGDILPVGEVGEVCGRGYCVMLGYHNNPEATEKSIDKDGWMHSGDLGTIDANGYLRITGRIKEMIIRGGENLYPAEIENAMLHHPAIAEVAVVGIPDEKWGEVVCCYIKLESGVDAVPAEALKAFARERMSPQKTPAHWVYIDEWPLTPSGKIQKFKLVEQFTQRQEHAV